MAVLFAFSLSEPILPPQTETAHDTTGSEQVASGPGAAARFSMGTVIASGMTVGTAFTLFVLPAFYLYLARDHAHDNPHAEAGDTVLETQMA